MRANSEKYARISKESAHKTIRSTVMFQGNYKEELQKVMDLTENAIENDLGDYFVVDSILGWNNNLKVRIDDQELGFERIVNCMFRHHHTDERYGNVYIDFTTTGLWIKTMKRSVGKFSIMDKQSIKDVILKNIIDCVKKSA